MGRWPARTLLDRAHPDDVAALMRLGVQRTLVRGHHVMLAGETASELALLLAGCVRVVGAPSLARANPPLVAIRVAGDLVGELAALDGEPRSASVVTASRTTLRIIDGTSFRTFLAERPRFALALALSLVTKLRMSTRLRVDVASDQTVTKVARVIDHLGEVYGRQTDDGVLVDVPLTRPDLAALVAGGEKSADRAVEELRRAGAVTTGYRRVVITDWEALRQKAGVDS